MSDDEIKEINSNILIAAISAMVGVFIIIFVIMNLSACTLSFQNISNEGTATDLIDENQKADATISPDIKVSPI